jgi:hypothetical protein
MLTNKKSFASKFNKFVLALVAIMVAAADGLFAQAERGVSALQDATNSLTQYFEVGVNVTYGAAAIIGLIGAVKVYQKWTQGDPDTGKVAGAWLGGAIFLAAVTTVLRVVFIN